MIGSNEQLRRGIITKMAIDQIHLQALKTILGTKGYSDDIDVMADAAHIIFNQDARENSGKFYVDDEVLASAGITDLSKYAVDPSSTLLQDF